MSLTQSEIRQREIEAETAHQQAAARIRELMKANPTKQLSGIKSNYARKVRYCMAMGVNAIDIAEPKPWRLQKVSK